MRFRYLADPLFIFCLITYALNRFYIKPHFATPFFHNSFNDLICIPFWVPIMLWIQMLCRARFTDGPPTSVEIASPLIVWSWMFEVWLPRTATLGKLSIADPLDIVCYCAGAAGAMIFWRVWYREKYAA